MTDVRRKGKKDAVSQLRAVLGRVRSKGFNVNERSRAFDYRRGIQSVLLAARVPGAVSSPRNFFRELRLLTGQESARFARQPIGEDFLRLLVLPEPVELDHEITWITERLRFDQPTINRFLGYVLQIQDQVLAGGYANAIDLLDSCDLELGRSLWSTELRIAVLQEGLGQDAQKTLLKHIKSLARTATWPFLSNAFSQRAEASVSIGWFLDDAQRRLGRSKQSDLTDYLRFRLLREWPSTGAGCASVLRVEQNHHVVDIYETFVSFLQYATSHRMPGLSPRTIAGAADDLAEIVGDRRIDKLKFVVTGEAGAGVGVVVDDVLSSAFSATDFGLRRDKTRRVLRAARPSLDQIMGLALLNGSGRERVSEERLRYPQLAIRGLSLAVCRRASREDQAQAASEEKLVKFCHMFGGLPAVKAIEELLKAATAVSTQEALSCLHVSVLNCPEYSGLDAISLAAKGDYAEIRKQLDTGPLREFCDVVSGSNADNEGLRRELRGFGVALNLFLRGDFDSAGKEVGGAIDSGIRAISVQAAALAINIHVHTGDVAEASRLIAREFIDNSVAPSLMPVREIFRGLDWRDMRHAASEFDLSVALSLVPSASHDDKLKTYRRFAIETLLARYGIERPSGFRSIERDIPSSRLIYFLSKVCTEAMLDMLPSINSSKAVLEERREICGYLTVADKENVDQHQQEVLELSRELAVIDGMRTIDGSRVHVDVDSLARVVRRDLAESFQRYQLLLQSGQGASESFMSVLKEMAKKETHAKYLLTMSIDEADELLVGMLARARERFLFDVPHGLDSYLSKRIRHGSIVGYLRAPAEREAVIAQRRTDGTYRTQGTWADRIDDPAQRAALADAIASFSRSIDQHLIRIRDVLLHVKSEAKPLGIFDAPLTPPTFAVIRSVASGDASLEAFVDTMFKSLWGLLGPSLQQAQNLLSVDSVALVTEQFRQLRLRAQQILKSSEDRASFDASAGSASTAMQAAIVAAASWFQPVESNPRSYTLDEVVAIAVQSVRATMNTFDPHVEITSGGSITFSEIALPTMSDVLYVAFGNIAGRANVGPRPKVVIAVEQRSDKLRVRVDNEAKPEGPEAALQEKLQNIRNELIAGVPARARLEVGSGLHKLSTIVGQGESGRLDFGYQDGWFHLELELEYSSERLF